MRNLKRKFDLGTSDKVFFGDLKVLREFKNDFNVVDGANG
ncbi:hypothetical protein LEP1GSC034_4457 [Leptospira interrogans str. 2003000735]|uniref:Uncharacterized protein n=9 Tax=Leptospira interrogans TaxID=173 RepID=M3I740_LEPIR|nr:hypothetical protein G436_0442 [Leptospira interrogans serovar Hardjo str. Norma]EJP02686.1 hypothetical protein LEP1GSC007_4319 [Leptospira interrogans serovar Bulgarica str. Mallika]EKN87306.1 hypothetical protein LEP1GSC027_3110 [Leptospira interrogans str. 2002000624]EKO06119.1 hypothetical protein LEP1GSC077_2632 [Leptospira interrogans str. C10069]EKO23004.1 hypothetical protein LEP1GSC104_4094 [Leptospira interrogans str. UI 12621]EKO87836.1 hypothetical protein LEP1GSC009_3279 [Lept